MGAGARLANIVSRNEQLKLRGIVMAARGKSIDERRYSSIHPEGGVELFFIKTANSIADDNRRKLRLRMLLCSGVKNFTFRMSHAKPRGLIAKRHRRLLFTFNFVVG